MKNGTKIIALLLCAALNTALLCACGDRGSAESPSGDAGSTVSKIVNLYVRTTSLSPSEIDYLIMRVNQELGSEV